MLQNLPGRGSFQFSRTVARSLSARLRLQAHLLACLVKWCTPADISPSFQMAGNPRVWMAELLAEDQSQQTTDKYRQISRCLQQLRLPHINCHRPATSSSQAKVLKLGIVVKQPWGTQHMVRHLLSQPHSRAPNGWRYAGAWLQREATKRSSHPSLVAECVMQPALPDLGR